MIMTIILYISISQCLLLRIIIKHFKNKKKIKSLTYAKQTIRSIMNYISNHSILGITSDLMHLVIDE